LSKARERNPNVKIYTNFGWVGENGDLDEVGWRFMIESWRKQDHPYIFAWDEIANSYDQHSVKRFPKKLLRLLTQLRKGPGIRIYAACQRFDNAEIDVRRLAKWIVEVRSYCGARWIKVTGYEGYENYNDGLPLIRPPSDRDWRRSAWTKQFIFSDALRASYDSFRIIKALGPDGAVEVDDMDEDSLDSEAYGRFMQGRREQYASKHDPVVRFRK
jgi:hypothetical protein